MYFVLLQHLYDDTLQNFASVLLLLIVCCTGVCVLLPNIAVKSQGLNVEGGNYFYGNTMPFTADLLAACCGFLLLFFFFIKVETVHLSCFSACSVHRFFSGQP